MSHTHPPGGDRPAGHGMVVVGTETVYLSHLPMFMKPHDFQVVLQARFGDDDQQTYVDDRAAHPKSLVYTLAPAPFVLPDILPPAPGKPPRLRTFRGDLFRGHFEQPGHGTDQIAADVDVTVDAVVLGRRFDPEAQAPDALAYVLFGAGAERWLAHVITGPPDFDQLVSVTITDPLDAKALAAGIPVTVPGRKNLAGERVGLDGGDAVAASAIVAGKNVPVELRPQVEFYFNDNADLQ
jgi:hypothetical protein